MSSTIATRKTDHLTLCATGNVGFRSATTLLEGVRLVHNALPDLDYGKLDLGVTMMGKRLRAPLCIASMTGGTDEAGRVNRELAALAEERQIAFALGSQRAMHVRHATAAPSYKVRDVAPTTLVLGNIGVVQAREMSTDQVAALVGEVGADGLCIHLNPAMELVQADGDRDFTRGLETIARLVESLPVPVLVKETGCGLSGALGRRLRQVGVRHADVSGAGGTSWVGVETERAKERGDAARKALGDAFWDWGIPTAVSVAQLAPLGFESLVATGGMSSGMDVARALALGATAGGIARPILRAHAAGGKDGAAAFLDGVESELRAAMLLTGSARVADLARAPRVIVGELGLWLSQLEGA